MVGGAGMTGIFGGAPAAEGELVLDFVVDSLVTVAVDVAIELLAAVAGRAAVPVVAGPVLDFVADSFVPTAPAVPVPLTEGVGLAAKVVERVAVVSTTSRAPMERIHRWKVCVVTVEGSFGMRVGKRRRNISQL